jgi:hypothetical protein
MTADTLAPDDPRSIRLAHLGAESAIKSLGQLCYLVAILSLVGTLEFVLLAVGVLPPDPTLLGYATPAQLGVLFWVLAGLIALNAAGQWVLGFGLTHLQGWARWTVIALTGLSLVSHLGTCFGLCFADPIWGLVALVVGGAIHALILYPLVTPSAGVVFSKPYREVVRQTPEVRARMHWLLKVCLGLIAAGLVGVVAYLAALYFRIID